MALLFVDGFDHCTNDHAAWITKWATSETGAGAPQTAAARTGVAGLSMGAYDAAFISKVLPASGGFAVGIALRSSDGWILGQDLLQIREGTTVHLALRITTAKLQVRRGDGTVLGTGTTTLASGSTWYYVEFKGVIHDTTGSFTVKLDSATELTGSGVDTRNGGATGQWDRIRLGADSNANQYDDLYVCDLSGSVNNDLLGPVKIETLMAQAGNGANTGLTPSTGTDHGALVDENPPNTTDYNGSPTVGAKDTYTLPSLVLTGSILGIQTNLYLAKSDAGARSVCAVARVGSTDYDGATIAPGTSYGYASEVRQVSPATSVAWTSTEIDGLEVGLKVTA